MLIFPCALLLAACPQQPDLLTALLRCEVHGASAFAAASVAAAVCADAGLLQQLQRDDDAGHFVLAATAAVRQGYLHAGFADAEVEGAVRDGALRLEVREGPQRRCGEIQVHGNHAVSTADIVQALQQGAESCWPAGAPARTDAASLAAIANKVRACYLRAGRHGAQAKVGCAPPQDKVELTVDIADEGQLVRVGRLQLDGERPADLEAVLQRVPFHAGAVYDQAFAEALQQQLLATGRYVQVAMPRGEQAIAGVLDPFPVQVRLTGFATAAAASRWDDLAQLQRGLDWLLRELQRGRAVRVEFQIAAGESTDCLGHRLSCTRVLLHLGADGLTAACDGLRLDDLPATTLRLVLRRQAALLAMLPGHYGYAHGEALLPLRIQVSSAPDADRMQIGFACNLQQGGASGLLLQLHPSTAAYLLQDDSLQWQRQGSDLIATTTDGSEVLRIGADGSMRARLVDNLPGGGRMTVTLADSDLDAVTQSMRPADATERPMFEELAALAAEGSSQLLARLPGDLQQDLALVRAAARFVADRHAASSAVAAPAGFSIPGAASDGSTTTSMALVAIALTSQFHGRGWLQTLLEALPALLLDRAHHQEAARRLFELGQRPDTGPLARLLIAAALQIAGQERAATELRRLAAEGCTFEAMWRDVEVLAATLDLGQDLQQLGAYWRRQPGLQAIFADCNGDDADAKALRTGFARLWQDGLDKLVQELIRAGG